MLYVLPACHVSPPFGDVTWIAPIENAASLVSLALPPL
jgi:hypothetical protein